MQRIEPPPTLVCLIGPPATGKTTVGRALCRHTSFLLFHGHIVADAISPFFPFGTPSFVRLSDTWRRTFIEEARRAGRSIVITLAWRFNLPEDEETIRSWLPPYLDGGRVLCVELSAPLAVRLERNRSEERRRHKNPYWVTDAYLREGEAMHQYDRGGTFPLDLPHLRLDITHLPPEDAALAIARHFSLPWTEEPGAGAEP